MASSRALSQVSPSKSVWASSRAAVHTLWNRQPTPLWSPPELEIRAQLGEGVEAATQRDGRAQIRKGYSTRMTRTLLVSVVLAVGSTGCDDGATGGDDPPPGADATPMYDAAVSDVSVDAPDARPDAEPEPRPDLSDPVFDPAHLIEVALEIDEADWDALREQARDGIDRRGEDCLSQPFQSPYTWFHARVTVDGSTYEDVAVRKKGFFGSVSSSKPSLKIRFDKYVPDQRHLSLTRLTLNNQRQDPSLFRTCLAYGLFTRAGLPAPRCNFAHLTVNGRDMGVFAHVEALKKPFLRRHFEDDSGHLYEGTLSDFRDAYRGTIEQKTDEGTPHTAPIDRLVAAAALPDDELIEGLEAVLDLDQFLSFWAMEVITVHWDGYSGNTNNFWFYDDPTSGRVVFIPWGPDATFQVPRLLFENRQAPWTVMATGILTRRLYLHPEGQARYLGRLDQLLDEVWDADALQAQIDDWTRLTNPALPGPQRRQHADAIADLKAWIDRHQRRLLTERLVGPAPWEVPLRGSFCQVAAGGAAGTFETTWGTWPTDDTFATGTGTFEGTYDDQPLQAQRVGAAVGNDERGAGVLIIPVFLVDDDLVFLFIAFDPRRVEAGEFELAGQSECGLNRFDPQTRQVTPLAQCPAGRLVFEEASRRRGATVRGRFEVEFWAEPGR